METIDKWGWFFSACAQSSATLVGIISALCVAKFFDMRRRLATFSHRLSELTKGLASLSDLLHDIDFKTIASRELDLRAAKLGYTTLAENETVNTFFREYGDVMLEKNDSLELVKLDFMKKNREVNVAHSKLKETVLLSNRRKLVSDMALVHECIVGFQGSLRSQSENQVAVSAIRQESLNVLMLSGIASLMFIVGVVYPMHALCFFRPGSLQLQVSIDSFQAAIGSFPGGILSTIVCCYSVYAIGLFWALRGIRRECLNLNQANARSLESFGREFDRARDLGKIRRERSISGLEKILNEGD